jgi:hypothetical protein
MGDNQAKKAGDDRPFSHYKVAKGKQHKPRKDYGDLHFDQKSA